MGNTQKMEEDESNSSNMEHEISEAVVGCNNEKGTKNSISSDDCNALESCDEKDAEQVESDHSEDNRVIVKLEKRRDSDPSPLTESQLSNCIFRVSIFDMVHSLYFFLFFI